MKRGILILCAVIMAFAYGCNTKPVTPIADDYRVCAFIWRSEERRVGKECR